MPSYEQLQGKPSGGQGSADAGSWLSGWSPLRSISQGIWAGSAQQNLPLAA